MAKRKKSGKSGRSSRPQSARHYPRTARLNTLLHRIVADHLEQVEEPELGFLTITGVEVDNDLNVAEVFVSLFEDTEDPARDEQILEILESHRTAVKGSISREAQLRKTPEVVFSFDPAVRSSTRLDSILRDIKSADAARAVDNQPTVVTADPTTAEEE